MTKREFKRAMQCGLGRCIWELKSANSIEKYRDIVLWGCTHNLSFDAQCEGTRSYYLYQMVNFFPDVSCFIEAVTPHFLRSRTNSGWRFTQYCRFLELFAIDGHPAALNTLKQCYRLLYDSLKNKQHTPDQRIPERENFEELCISIVNTAAGDDCVQLFLKIAEEIGVLILDNPLFANWNFDWFHAYWEDKAGKVEMHRLLKQHAAKSAGIKSYYTALKCEESRCKQNTEARRNKMKSMTADKIYAMLTHGAVVGKDISPLLSRFPERMEIHKLADYYQNEADLSLRAQLLWLLSNKDCAPSLNVQTVINDSNSDCKSLQQHALTALQNITSDQVHTYALVLLQKGEHLTEAIQMLAKNYQKEDHAHFVSLIQSLPVTYQEAIPWHGPYMATLDLLETPHVQCPPKELLPHMYTHCLCSFCREYILREMQRRRMLTDDILRECLYDSNDDIRIYARKKLQEKGKKEETFV